MLLPNDILGIPLVLASFIMSIAVMAWLLGSGKAVLFLDRPNQRSLHSNPTPRFGGIAIVSTVMLALLMLNWDWPVTLSLAALATLSVVDDMRGMPVIVRLVVHTLAAMAVVLLYAPGIPVWASALIVCGMIWMTNLYNFMDGSDGLAGGMAVVGFACLGIAAAQSQDTIFALGCFCISAASLGFLLFNFHPARAFMGDSGSISLGFLAGALSVAGWTKGYWSILFPIVVFSPFIADATVTLVRRGARGMRLWEAHREHYYQRLIQMGWNHRKTALAAYCAMLIAGGAALASRSSEISLPALATTLLTGLGYATVFYLIDARCGKRVTSCQGR